MKKFLLFLLCLLFSARVTANEIIPSNYSLPKQKIVIIDTNVDEYKFKYEYDFTQENWDKSKNMAITWQVLHVIDTIQTYECVHKTKHCYETNFLLGKHPTKSDIIGWSLTSSVFHWVISRELAKKNPQAGILFQIGTIGHKTKTVISNARIIW